MATSPVRSPVRPGPFPARRQARRRALRGRHPARRGHHRRRRPPGRPDRAPHRPLAARQVHRRRAHDPRPHLVGPGQPADQRGRLRPAAHAPGRLPAPTATCTSSTPRSAPTRPIAGRCASTPRRPGPASSRGTSSASRCRATRRRDPDFTIICVPSFKADPATEGTRTETAILVHLQRMEVIIVGTEYAGEIKKSAFTVMNDLLPDEGVLPMHSRDQRRRGGRPGRSSSACRGPARRRSRPTRGAA